MDRPIRSLLLLSMAFGGAATAAEPEAAAVAMATQTRTRAVSLHTAALLTAGLPKLEPAKSGADKPAAADTTDQTSSVPANGIIRLSRYLVREPRLPTPQEIWTRREQENYAMNRFIGPEDGLDRGYLNFFTIADLWKKIPVLGRFPFFGSETNAERGMRLYAEAERKRKMEELMGLVALTRKAGDTAEAKKMKQEANQTFIRRADFGK